MSALEENIQDGADAQEGSRDQDISHADNHSNQDQQKWVRRSRRERKQVEMLQADGKKKSYSSSKAVDIDDSE